MTKPLDQALKAARALSPDAQDDIARVVLQLANEDAVSPQPLLANERAAIERSREAARQGGFASDDEVRSVWAKHGL
jgi:hypothetical protein